MHSVTHWAGTKGMRPVSGGTDISRCFLRDLGVTGRDAEVPTRRTAWREQERESLQPDDRLGWGAPMGEQPRGDDRGT